jgi:RHS repeat-associated protein
MEVSVQLRILALIVAIPTLALQCMCQTALSGTPPFNTISSNGIDSVNLGNLNVHLNIPIYSRAGRGMPFNFSLTYDSNFWRKSGQSWSPTQSFGWGTSNLGSVTYDPVQGSLCPAPSGNIHETNLTNFVYTDPNGTPHAMNGTAVNGSMCDTIYVRSSTGSAKDGSGFSLWFIPNADGTQSWYVTDPAGTVYSSGGLIQDRNGNQIGTGNTNVDTLGTTVLTKSGTPPSVSYTYSAPGGSKSVVVTYLSHTIRTNFGGSYVVNSQAYPTTQYNSTGYLPDRVTYPDGTYYQFTYEATWNIAGAVTGRLATVRLPTGATISYTYGDGTTVTSYGAPRALSRTTPDGTWQYISFPSVINSTWVAQSNITDPSNNQKTIIFTIGPDGGYYKTSATEYLGTTTVLRKSATCYGASAPPCDGTAITLPISTVTTYSYLPDSTGVTSKTMVTGGVFPTQIDEYNFGPQAGGTGPLLRETRISYSSFSNSFNGSFKKPSSVGIYDGSFNVKALTTYGYDQTAVVGTSGTLNHVNPGSARGNLTTLNRFVSGTTTYLSWNATYFDTGLVDTVTDPAGSQTTVTYGACNNSFPTYVQLPMNLHRSATWDCTGAVQKSSTDENTATAGTGYGDSNFWRPTSSTDQLSNVTSISYPSSTQVESVLPVVAGTSVVDMLSTTDLLGRRFVSQQRQAPGSGNFDSTQVTYNSSGRVASEVLPYQAGGGQGATNPHGVSILYDGIGRPLSKSDSGNGSIIYNYNYNDVLEDAGPSSKQIEYDALGRISSVCEIVSAANGGGTCGQNKPQTGIWTKYSYDPLGDLLTVQQNAQGSPVQTRSFTYDELGRQLSETTPESGTKTYVYDFDATMCSNGAYTSNGDLVKSVDAAGNCVMRYYDQLHRLTDVGNSNQAVSHCKRYRYDNSGGYPGSVKPAGLTNTIGRLIEAATDMCDNTGDAIITDEWFSYSARGEISDVYQSTPHSGGYYHVGVTYWPHGQMKQLSGLNGVPAIYYGASDGTGLDGEGRVTKVTAASGQNPASAATYDPTNGTLTGVTYGSADSDIFHYDLSTLRMTSYATTVGSQTANYALGWNTDGTLNQLAINDPFNSANSQTCNFTYDERTRIKSTSCGVWAQTFNFDAFGNTTKSGNQSFNPTYNQATNRINGGGYSTSYDANGNQLDDGIHLQSYTWNVDNNPITITGASTTTVIYDALGRAVENQNGSNTEILYGPSGGKLALLNGSSLVKAFIPIVGGGTAVYTSVGLAYYRHADWLGTSRLASTPSRTVYFSGAYAPYGEGYAQSGTADWSFTGQNQDTLPNLDDFQFRRYSPVQGRWISPDPVSSADLAHPQSWNRYAYVQNNPNSFTDVLGLWCSGTNGLGDTPCNPGNDPQYGGGFGGGWDEFDAMNIPVYGGLQYGSFVTNVYLGSTSYGGGLFSDEYLVHVGLFYPYLGTAGLSFISGADTSQTSKGPTAPKVCSSGGDPRWYPGSVSLVAGAEYTNGFTSQTSYQPTVGAFQSLTSLRSYGAFTSNTSRTYVAGGLYGGAGLGGMLSNANNVSQLQLTNSTTTISTPLVSASWSTGGGVWEFQLTFGPGAVFGYSETSSNTKIAHSSVPCP